MRGRGGKRRFEMIEVIIHYTSPVNPKMDTGRIIKVRKDFWDISSKERAQICKSFENKWTAVYKYRSE